MSRKTLLIRKHLTEKLITGGMNGIGPHDSDAAWYAKYFKGKQEQFEKEYSQALKERHK